MPRLGQSLQQRAVPVVQLQIHGHDSMVREWYQSASSSHATRIDTQGELTG